VNAHVGAGRKRKLSNIDLFLLYAKRSGGSSYSKLGSFFGLSKTATKANLDFVNNIIKKMPAENDY